MKKLIKFTFLAVLLFSSKAFSQNFSQTKPLVTSITASKVTINKINIKWKVPANFTAASIAIFRDSKPISTTASILSLKPAGEVPAQTTVYTDTLTHYGEYYYALIARDKNGNLFDIIVPSSNATIEPVILEKPAVAGNEPNPVEPIYQPAYLRDLPLPYLDFITDIDRRPTVFKAKTLLAARELAGKYYNSKRPVLEPYVFEEDLVCAPSGDDYYLFQSLKTYFIQKDYKNSVTDLKKYLTVSRDPYTAARAVFYLAESQYYCRNYRSALTLFLFLEDTFPETAKKWVDSTLDQYTIPYKTTK